MEVGSMGTDIIFQFTDLSW